MTFNGKKITKEDIKNIAKKNNVCLWKIADELGITDNSFSRKLRKELSPETKSQIKEIIKKLTK